MEEFKGELGEGFGLRSEADDEAQRTPGSPGENGRPSLTEGRIGFQQGPQQRLTEGQLIASVLSKKIAAGASLVQIYSGFIYKGPALIREAVDAIAALPRS